MQRALGLSPDAWTGVIPLCRIDHDRAEFLATMIDTEGCVSIRRGSNGGGTISYRAVVTITNTSAPLIEKARSAIGFGPVYEARGCNRRVFNYVVTGPRAAGVLSAVYQFLIVKKSQAAIAIYLQGLIRTFGGAHGRVRRDPALTAALERCHAAVSSLNQGALPDLGWLSACGVDSPQTEAPVVPALRPSFESQLTRQLAPIQVSVGSRPPLGDGVSLQDD